jgi:hypothetical protein
LCSTGFSDSYQYGTVTGVVYTTDALTSPHRL